MKKFIIYYPLFIIIFLIINSCKSENEDFLIGTYCYLNYDSNGILLTNKNSKMWLSDIFKASRMDLQINGDESNQNYYSEIQFKKDHSFILKKRGWMIKDSLIGEKENGTWKYENQKLTLYENQKDSQHKIVYEILEKDSIRILMKTIDQNYKVEKKGYKVEVSYDK